MDLNHQWSNLPPEMIFDIVSKLPVKPLYRFKAVSKSWLDFINNLIISSIKSKPQKLIISCRTCSSPFYTLDSWSLHKWEELRGFSDSFFQIVGSCNGIVLVRSDINFFLWNPLTRKHRPIEPPCYLILAGLSYDSVTKDLKVVFVTVESCKDSAYVFSSLSSSWNSITYTYGYLGAQEAVDVNGSPHWIVVRPQAPDVILYFDPHEDKFGELPIPFIGWVQTYLKLTALGGDLCAVNDNNVSDTIDVWLVKDSSWRKLFVVPSRQGEFCARTLLPLCFMDKEGLNNEVVIQLDSHTLALFNLKKKEFKRIELPSECESYTFACYEETFASP